MRIIAFDELYKALLERLQNANESLTKLRMLYFLTCKKCFFAHYAVILSFAF